MLVRFACTCVRAGTRVTLGLAVGAGAASILQGQSPTETREGPSWALTGLRTVQCVRFLVEPGAAAREGGRDRYLPLRADQDQALHPALRSVIQGQPEFASWTPSSLCFFHVDTVTVGGRTIAAKNVRRLHMIAVWTLATSEQGSGARRDMVLDFLAGSAQLVRAAAAVKLRIHEADSKVSQVPESTDERHEVRIGKTHLVWNGREAGDSIRIEQPIEETWSMKGSSGTTWVVRMKLAPSWTRPLVGVLSVDGKGDLAKRLKASPIRFVGPRYLGGSAELVLSR